MRRTHWPVVLKCSCTMVAVLVSTLQSFAQATDKQPQTSSRTVAVKEVLSWLPGDTETVVAANGPFPFPDFDSLERNDSEQQLPFSELEARMRSLPLGLFDLKNGGLAKRLKGKEATLAVEGSRHFRPPAALGGMRYEGCEIVAFSPAISLDRASFLRNAAASAVRFEEIAGLKIAVFEEQQENDVWTTFVGFPRNNIVLVATNKDYLRTVLMRMGNASGPRALPADLPEWTYVNTSATVWGLRHYQKVNADLDPTSPFSGKKAANVPDDLAVGLGFWFEPAGRMAHVIYLSASKDARQVVQSYLSLADAESASPEELQIRLRERAPNVIEGTVELPAAEVFSRFLFGLLAMLGHAVYL
jgi:hypothetical protein